MGFVLLLFRWRRGRSQAGREEEVHHQRRRTRTVRLCLERKRKAEKVTERKILRKIGCFSMFGFATEMK